MTFTKIICPARFVRHDPVMPGINYFEIEAGYGVQLGFLACLLSPHTCLACYCPGDRLLDAVPPSHPYVFRPVENRGEKLRPGKRVFCCRQRRIALCKREHSAARSVTVRATISGCAGFVVSPAANNGQLFGLLLTDGAITSNVHRVYISGISSRLEIGEYAIGNSAFSGVFTSAVNPEVFSVMPDQRSFALRGTLTITSSSSAMLSGSVDVTGTDAGGADVAVTGSFTAKCVAASGAVC